MTAGALWPYPRFLAHRGGGALAPENTLAAFDAGWHHGYRAAEIDAALSADEIPVLLHDARLERTSNGHGLVCAHTAAQLALLDAGSWFGAAFAGAGLPTLEQALQHCSARGIWLNVEIKPVPGHEERTGTRVAQVVERFWREGHAGALAPPVLSSFSSVALAAARAAAPGLPRGLLCAAPPRNWRARLEDLQCVALHCDHRRLTQRMAHTVRTAGWGLMCYTVNEPERVRALFSWGVDAVCTDRIDRIAPAAT